RVRCGVRSLKRLPGAIRRRQLVPARSIFLLIFQFNFRRKGLLPGWGALAFVWLESVGVDAVVALGRAVRAPIQRDIFAQSDRHGGLHFGGTTGRCGATFARRCVGATNSHTTSSSATPTGGGAPTSPDDHVDAAQARDGACVARAGDHIERDFLACLAWSQACLLCPAR